MIVITKRGNNMAWTVKIKHREEQIVSRWSGGTTTELALYPPNSSYKNRDFLWRISSAIVEDAKSTFTTLPDYNRIIMPLRGEVLKLSHQNHYDKKLYPLETDCFHGSWTTISEGRVQDFNLIFTAACGGCVRGYRIKPDMTINTDVTSLQGTGEAVNISLYILGSTGKIILSTKNDKFNLLDGDFIAFTGGIADESLIFNMDIDGNEENAIVVCTTIRYSSRKGEKNGL
jgi:uncharacterized protein